ncbi:homoserine O-succinyltransferase [Acetobacterium paludosum]|uniref:Probable acyltransferase n=1 Tax=Acetobacterium paludosum TaxID=52693 RepID=A0A923HZ24_9FIRM|nr:homoserine O-succinyltransferase [Acetobacterium paludosum]MBC3889239.1 homoserine O-succinyltransferase [Acetobacterium paludosum]
MPICVKEGLPAIEALANENIFIMSESRAEHQDIRTLRILIVNLMPTVIATETQLLRLLSNTSLQLSVEFLKISTHIPKNSILEHLHQFYMTFEEIKNKSYDGMIITGAPIGQLEFEEADCWDELCEVMEWAKYHVNSALYSCWSAYAALHYHFGLNKCNLSNKLSGIYAHTVNIRRHPIVRGFDDIFMAPHSRDIAINKEELLKISELDILAESEKAGVYLIADTNNKQLFVTGHCEFDRAALESEYIQDCLKGLNPKFPENFQIKDKSPFSKQTSWNSHASLLFSNWLNYYVYQQTPYRLSDIGYKNNIEKMGKLSVAK